MFNKKVGVIIAGSIIILGGLSWWANKHALPREVFTGPEPTAIPGQTPWANQRIDFGGKKPAEELTWQINPGDTVLSLLTRRKTVNTKTYDFGTSVESIDGVGNDATAKQYWMYFINGQEGTRGADSQILKNGDRVEWRLVTTK